MNNCDGRRDDRKKEERKAGLGQNSREGDFIIFLHFFAFSEVLVLNVFFILNCESKI